MFIRIRQRQPEQVAALRHCLGKENLVSQQGESGTGGRLALLPAVKIIKARRVPQIGHQAGYQRSKVNVKRRICSKSQGLTYFGLVTLVIVLFTFSPRIGWSLLSSSKLLLLCCVSAAKVICSKSA